MKDEEVLNRIIMACIAGIILGFSLCSILVQSGQMDGLMTTEQCINQSSLYYQQGIIDVANFTTITGNFTYIFNNSIRNQGVQDYCLQLINIQGGK